MSALMLVLLSGLVMVGAVTVAPDDVMDEGETPDDSATDAQTPAEGSNPLDEATAPEASATEPAPEQTPTPDPSTETTDAGSSGGSSGQESGGSSQNATVTGTDASTIIPGTPIADSISAGGGDDTVEGLGGADTINGDDGDDILYGARNTLQDDTEVDLLNGGAGSDEINLANSDIGTGGEGADRFVRLESVTGRILITDFDAAEDVIVVEHQSDTVPTIDQQRIASDGVIIELSDGSNIELAGLVAPIDPALVSFVDTRVT